MSAGTPSLESLQFRGSPETTLGVEIELQILDRETGELAPGAVRILEACKEEGIEGVSGEFLLSMLEIKTGVCRNVTAVRDELTGILARVLPIVRSFGYELSAGGTHPFARPTASAIFPDERYERIRQRHGLLAYQECVFGMHVHVGVPGEAEALGLISLLVPYLPHLLALSANSPFWQGADSGFASTRAVMFRPSGHAGVPPHFSSWQHFGDFCRALHGARLLQATKDLYWDIRPRPAIGTLEFRIFDTPANLETVLGLAALTRCLVIDGLQRLRDDPKLQEGDPVNHWLAEENKLLAARFGLETRIVCQPGREPGTIAVDMETLLERLAPVARAAGEEEFLRVIAPARLDCGADCQRRLFRRTGNWRAVVDDMRNRWTSSLGTLASHGSANPAPASVNGHG